MKRRSRSRASIQVNYWPGYVDALTNVVLNLLFLIAMFGIALSVLNSSPRSGRGKSGQAADTATGTVASAALPGLGAGAADGQGAPVRVLPPGGGPAFVLRYGPPGPVTGPIAGLADAVPSRDNGSPGRPAASAPEGTRSPNDTLSPPRLASAGPTALSGPPANARRDGPGQQGGGYAPAGAAGAALDFGVVDAYQRRFMPGVRLVRSPAPQGAVLVTVNLAIGTEPVAALRQPAVGTALAAGLALGEGKQAKIRIWTATRLSDPVLRRTAYLALIEARNQLLALGYPASAIETRLVEGTAATRDEKQIFILAVPANRN